MWEKHEIDFSGLEKRQRRKGMAAEKQRGRGEGRRIGFLNQGQRGLSGTNVFVFSFLLLMFLTPSVF